tara:strand:- start:7274 stop:7771 length:498 start_codon:yes stop_codon:yes gene_type:complete
MVCWSTRTVALALLVLGSSSAASCSRSSGNATNPSPDFATLRDETWQDRTLEESGLLQWIQGGAEALPIPAQVVVYRKGCGVCAHHLSSLDRTAGRVPLVLIRVPDERDADEETDARDFAPEHHVHLELIALPRGYGFTAPATFFVDATRTIRQVRRAVELSEQR